MTNRRQLLFSAAALGLAAAAPRFAAAREGAPATGEAAKLNALFDDLMARQLRQAPELATALGVDSGDLAWTKSELSDASLQALADNKASNIEGLNRLKSIDRSKLSGNDAINYDTVEFVLATQAEGDAAFSYGTGGSGSPYVISQLTGSYQSMPDFLDNQHSIETKADADAYLARLEGFSRLLDQETVIARRDGAQGVIPPDFIIDKTIIQLKTMIANGADKSPLVESVARRAKAKGIAGDYAGMAGKIYEEQIRPALARQQALMEEWRPKATHDAGCWRLPKGDEYYAVSLTNYTTSTITPDEIHQTGLDLCKSLSAEADKLMKKAGYTKGTVGERFRAMYSDPKLQYENTDAGKEKLIADLNAKVEVIQAKLPAWFGALPKAKLVIKRVPKAIEAGAPGGYYNGPSLDGSRPGIYWINLRDTAEVPSWTLPTLTYHEGIPGHHLQGSLSNEAGDLPLIRKVIWFSGYGEGWALYAEELAIEMGMYDKDVLGHIGQIHDAMFRAVRLVVDSGMHHKKWSREQALKFFVDTIGDQETGAITEVERYCAWPGQACSYMVGKIDWLKVRAKAKKELGKKFDIRKFHDAGLLSGAMPLTVLDSAIDNYIASTKAAK